MCSSDLEANAEHDFRLKRLIGMPRTMERAQYFFVPSARRQCRTDLLTPESQEERKDKDMVLFQLAFWAVVKFKFV